MIDEEKSTPAVRVGSNEINETRRSTYSKEPDFDSCAGQFSRPHSALSSSECFTVRGRVGVGSGTSRVEVGVLVAIRILESSVESD